VTGAEDYSQTRGRELPGVTPGKVCGPSILSSSNDSLTFSLLSIKVYASGRGGAGNIRSPSREATIENKNALREEAQYVREHTNTDVPVCTSLALRLWKGLILSCYHRYPMDAVELETFPTHALVPAPVILELLLAILLP
jgi:hypothetical protein